MKLGFIGCGNMAKAMLGGILKNEICAKEDVIATAKSEASRENARNTYGIQVTADNIEAAKSADVLVLAVKPIFYEEVIREIKEETGIDVTNAEGGYAFSYKRVNPEEKNNYFVDIYKFVLEFDESDVKTQEEEVSGFAIADLNEIKRYADEGIFLHYDSIRQAFEE